MKTGTPRGRLQHWLREAHYSDEERATYGFHSLRSGAATDAHRQGVTEEEIKLHGNWKSDAVQVYMRPAMEARLRTSGALGEQED